MAYNSEELAFLTIDSILLVLVISGNLGVIVILVLKSNLQKPTNASLCSLAAADLLVGVFVIPNVIILRFTDLQWKAPVCKMCLYLEYSSAAVSAFTISAMTIDRFRAIVTPLKYRQQQLQFLVGTLICVWILSFLYGLRIPLIYTTGTSHVTVNNVTTVVYVCTIPDADIFKHQLITILDFILIFIVPSTILGICNFIVSFKLENQAVESSNSQHNFRRRRKAIRLLLLMTALFIVCHLPLYSFRLHVIRSKGRVENKGTIIQCLLILSWCNSVLNILFYGSLNDSVKNCVFGLLRKCNNRRVHPDMNINTNLPTFATTTANQNHPTEIQS